MRSSGRKAEHSVLKRVLVSHLQLIGMVMSMNVPWPKELVDVVSVLSSLTTISRHVSEIKCSASHSLSQPMNEAAYFYGIIYRRILTTISTVLTCLFLLGCILTKFKVLAVQPEVARIPCTMLFGQA